MEQGPVYEMERNHHFQQLMIHAQDLKKLSAPVYDVEKDHHFQVWTLLLNYLLFPFHEKLEIYPALPGLKHWYVKGPIQQTSYQA